MKVTYRALEGKKTRGILIAVLLLLLLSALFVLTACGKGGGTGDSFSVSISDDFQTQYFIGESFVASGTLTVKHSDGSVESYPITAEMVSNFDTSSAGDVTVTVTYGEYSATVPIRVLAITATSISIDADTLPTAFYQNDPFPEGVTLTASMSDGSSLTVAVKTSMLGGFDPSYIGTQNVTITYLGATTSCLLTVKVDELHEISLLDAKAEYAVNESLFIGEAKLRLTYESGKSLRIALTSDLVFDFSTALGGDHVAKIAYESLTCDYPYFVRKKPMSFALDEKTLPITFEKGDPFPSGIVGVLTYDDTSIDLISVTEEDSLDFDTSAAGEKKVRITVSDLSDYFSYTVLPSIVSATPFGFTSAVMQGEPFDGLGELIVVYEDGVRESIALSSDRLTVSYDTSVVGEIHQNIAFRRQEIFFETRVYSEEERNSVDYIEIIGDFSPIKVGGRLNVENVQVWIVYRYLSPATVPCDQTWVSVEMPNAIEGDYQTFPVTVSCFGASAQASVRVLSEDYAARVTALNARGFKVLYVVGDALLLQNATLSATYGGGYAYVENIPVDESFISDFDASTVGEKRMTVTYKGFSIGVSYKVISEEDATRVTDLEIYGFDPLLFEGADVDDIDVSKYTVGLTFGYGYSRGEIPLSAEMLSGGPFDEVGRKTVVVTYRGCSRTFPVTVHSIDDRSVVTAIRVPDMIYGYVGMSPNLSEVELEVVYGYGYEVRRIALSSEGVSVSPFSSASAGFVRVEVAYAGCSCGAYISFASGDSENILQKIEIAQDSRRMFAVGEALSNVYLIAYYSGNRMPEKISVSPEMAPDFTTVETGNYVITISYGGKAAVFAYAIEPGEIQSE